MDCRHQIFGFFSPMGSFFASHWQISRDLALSDPSKVCARLQTPLLPSMFKASSPVKLTIDSDAMLQDELFIILALIYSEVKRQDITVRFKLVKNVLLLKSSALRRLPL